MAESTRLALIRTRVEAEAALVDADPAYEREPIGKGCLPVRREDVEWLLERAEGEPLALPLADERLAQIRERVEKERAARKASGTPDYFSEGHALNRAWFCECAAEDVLWLLARITDLTERLQVAHAAGQESMRERAAQHLDAVARDCSAARRGLPEAAADHIRHLPPEETDA